MLSSFLSATVKKRNVFIAGVVLFLVISFMFMMPERDMREEQELLLKKIGELQLKVQHLTSLYEIRNYDVRMLTRQIANISGCLSSNSILCDEAKIYYNTSCIDSADIKFPTIRTFLPHLRNYSILQPAYRYSKGRSDVSVVMGIPTVKRAAQSYLLPTLADLIHKMTPLERNDSLIIVLIAEVDSSYVAQVIEDIKNEFEEYLESGLLEIIAPPAWYYPSFDNVKKTLGDPLERVRWRSKQNLDFAFLMMYAYQRGVVYLQLEDDIVAKDNYLSIMKKAAYIRTVTRRQWFVLDFCQLGFIGKMFRNSDLPWLIEFFLMFYSDKPVDWLLDGLIQTKACNLEKDAKDCKRRKNELWVHHEQSLFQHIGTTSSLKGKVQKLKDKHFGKVALFTAHTNPPATVNTSLTAYKTHTLRRAYYGETFFWGLTPKAKDWLSFKFHQPINIKQYRFRSGNAEHPSDRLYNTTVHAILPVELPSHKVSSRLENDIRKQSTFTIGYFNKLGLAEGTVTAQLGPISEILLTVQAENENWVILSEILIEEATDYDVADT